MTQIDTSKWGKFRVGDLFEIKPTKSYKMRNADLLDGGNTPVVVNSAFNNGIGGFTTQEPTEKGGIITFSDTVDANTIFYQEKPFTGYSHVQGVYPVGEWANEWDKYSLLFFASCFKSTALRYGFDYSNKFRRDVALELKVLLPQTPDHTPDFDYMENYMKNLIKLAAKRVEKVKEEKPKYKIDTKDWGKFRVGDLFTVYLGDYNNPKFLTEDENGIPLVSATAINNGISGYYKKTSDLKVITKNKITWGKQCPYFYYQTTDFITGQGTYYLDVSALSFYTSLFICAVLNNEISQKYDYNNCLIGKKLSEEIILLPITTKGSPDWQFMEDYMKNIMEQAEKKFSNIPQ